MAVQKVTVNGIEYPIAPLVPELHDHPASANLMAITPEVARAWLRYNYRNRNQRDNGLKNYASDMEKGNFAINGATVTFSRPLAEGEDPDVPTGQPCLMDGQHRLESCASGKKPFVTYVAYGLSPDVRPTIDTGIKRNFGDVLAMRGEKNTMVLGSVINRVHAWENGDCHLTMKKGTHTHAQLLDFFGDHPEIRRSSDIASRTEGSFQLGTGHTIRQSVLGIAHWLFMRADEAVAPEFFARIGDGTMADFDAPIMQLRRRLVKDLKVKRQPEGGTRREIVYVADWQQLCYYIRTWNNHLMWVVATDSERSRMPKYQMVGPTDAQRMPAIKTMKDIEVMVDMQRTAREEAMSA